MVYNREEAARRAELSKTNTPGYCQKWTRDIFGAPSAGDRDGDNDADAVDGWRSEPASSRHAERNPPRGVPVAFRGGRNGYGHRAISLGGGKIRSTDMTSTGYKAGVVGTTTIPQIEEAMGVTYMGWSDTITGIRIPLPPPPPMSRGVRVDSAISNLEKAEKYAKEGTSRDTLLDRALTSLRRIKPFRRR